MYEERVLLPDGVLLDVVFHSRSDFRLSLLKNKRTLVEYSSNKPYEFKSVEKLRYDFERDVESALRKGR